MVEFELVSTTGDVTVRVGADRSTRVGRGSMGEFAILDPSISRRHAQLTCTDDGLAIEDLGSTNGTFVNDERVTKSVAADGDVLKFGNVAFRVTRVRGPEPDSAIGTDDVLDATILEQTALRAMPVPLVSPDELLGGPGASAALYRAAHPEDQQEGRFRRLELLLGISKKLSQNASLDSLLETIVDVTCRTMNVHRVSILLVDASGGIKPLISRDRGRRASDLKLPASILKRVVEDKVAVRTDNAGADDRFGGPSIVVQNVCGAMCTPLISSTSEVMGAIYVDNLTPLGSYTDEDLEFLIGFGGIAGAAIENNRLSHTLRTNAISLSNFERYFAPELAAAITRERDQIQLGGDKRCVAILFSDVRGFSTLSEKMLPEAVVAMLNAYFSEMVDIVFEHEGTLQKFIGDAIMANWGAPVPHPDAADRALRAAIDMQRELIEMNARRAPQDPKIEVGIGINQGDAFVGNIGSHRRLEYTVIGDPVNVASRLCSTARAGEIIISDSLYEALREKPAVTALEPIQLRGRSERTACYRVQW